MGCQLISGGKGMLGFVCSHEKPKALSLLQPWASLLVFGLKRIETRSWPTRYRGWVLIHASARIPAAALELSRNDPFYRAAIDEMLAQSVDPGKLRERSVRDLPVGQIIGRAELVDCVKVEDVRHLSNIERCFGDYTPGRWAWLMGEYRRFKTPIPCRGALGLWTPPPEVVSAVLEEEA